MVKDARRHRFETELNDGAAGEEAMARPGMTWITTGIATAMLALGAHGAAVAQTSDQEETQHEIGAGRPI